MEGPHQVFGRQESKLRTMSEVPRAGQRSESIVGRWQQRLRMHETLACVSLAGSTGRLFGSCNGRAVVVTGLGGGWRVETARVQQGSKVKKKKRGWEKRGATGTPRSAPGSICGLPYTPAAVQTGSRSDGRRKCQSRRRAAHPQIVRWRILSLTE